MDITTFFYSGYLKELQIGKPLELESKNLVHSLDTYKNGLPKFFQYTQKGLKIDVGNNSKGLIKYIVVHLHKQKCLLEVKIGEKKIVLKKIKFSNLIKLLNENNIDWEFKNLLGKFVSIVVLNSNIELVFSFEDKGDGNLEIIQTPPM